MNIVSHALRSRVIVSYCAFTMHLLSDNANAIQPAIVEDPNGTYGSRREARGTDLVPGVYIVPLLLERSEDYYLATPQPRVVSV